jgi:hypothetical protein
MRNRHWLSLMVLALISAGAPARAEEFLRPWRMELMMPQAVDHVAEMAMLGPTQRREKTIFVYRSGKRQREDTRYADGVRISMYADLADNMSWILTSEANGAFSHLVITGPRTPPPRIDSYPWTINRTNVTGHHLGEACIVWSLSKLPHPSHQVSIENSCLTDDGILLWRKVYYGDKLVHSARAIAIKRRQVGLDEVTVPASALKLSSYGHWDRQVKGTPNDQVRFDSGSVVRRIGTLKVTQETFPNVTQHTWSNGTHWLSVSVNTDGSLDNLMVGPTPPIFPAMKPQPMKPRRFLTIIGERCELFEMRPGVADAGLTECLRKDGLSLKRIYESRGAPRYYNAMSVSRGKMTVKDVAPPTDIMTGGWKRLAPRPRK